MKTNPTNNEENTKVEPQAEPTVEPKAEPKAEPTVEVEPPIDSSKPMVMEKPIITAEDTVIDNRATKLMDSVKKRAYAEGDSTGEVTGPSVEGVADPTPPPTVEEKPNFFSWGTKKPLEEAPREEVVPEMNYQDFDEPEITPTTGVGTKLTMSKFICDNLALGTTEGMNLYAKISEKEIVNSDLTLEYKTELLDFAKKRNAVNKKLFEVPDGIMNSIRPGVEQLCIDKGIENSLPSYLPLVLGIAALLFWGYKTATEVKVQNELYFGKFMTQIGAKQNEQDQKIANMLKQQEELEKQLNKVKNQTQ